MSQMVGWDRGADRASNDADVSSILPIIPYGGFSPVRLEGWRIRRDLPEASISLSLLPACADRRPVCLRPSCTAWSLRYPALCRAADSIMHCRVGDYPTAPEALAQVRVFCPGPSSLNRPHPPHSQAHRNFTAWRLIRDAFAVRERRGDPRVVPGFHCSFLPGMPSSPTPGSSTSISRIFDADIGLRRMTTGSALPTLPQSVSRGR